MKNTGIAGLLFIAMFCLLSASASAASTQRDMAKDKTTSIQTGKALFENGNALLKEKRFAEALVAFTRSIDAYPESSAAWANRGLAYANMGPANYDAARENFDKAISLNPKNDHAYFNRAVLNKRTGRQQAFLDDLRAAAQLGNKLAQQELQKVQAETAAPQPAHAAGGNTAPANPTPLPTGGYDTCTLPSDHVAMIGGAERPTDPAYKSVCVAMIPPSCRNWTVSHQPCAYRSCIVKANVSHCPNGDPTAYVAKQTLPFTKEDFAQMDSMIAAEAQRIAAKRGPAPTGNAAATAQYYQEQLNHRMVEFGNGNAGGVTYNGQ